MLKDGQAAATLAVADLDRARKFYTDTLGFSVMDEGPMGLLLQAGQGTVLFVYPSEFAGTNKATAASFNVADFDATIEDLRGRGITFLEFDYEGMKTENGVMQTPEGPAAWFTDPDGNIINVGHMEMPSS